MKKTRVYQSKPITTVGEAVEAQFDEMDRNLSRLTPRNLKQYNTIVALTKMLSARRKGHFADTGMHKTNQVPL